MVIYSKSKLNLLKKTRKFLIVYSLILFSLFCLFIISYKFTLNSGSLKNSPQITLSKFCDAINHSNFTESQTYVNESYEISVLLKDTYNNINIKTSSMHNILKDENEATYNIEITLEETSKDGSKSYITKEIPVRFNKIDDNWYLTNDSVKNIFNKL